MVAAIERGKVTLFSRNGKIISDNYLPVAKALEKVSGSAVIDGELVALDPHGISRFQLLQNALRAEAKLLYCAFDILFADGDDLRGLPLLERKDRLRRILPKHPLLAFSEHHPGHGVRFFKKAELGLASLLQADPRLHLVLKYVGAIYLLYLAWRIARADPASGNKAQAKPISFVEAAIFTWTNPKAWVTALGALAAYIVEAGNGLLQTLIIASVLSGVCFVAVAIWAGFGAAISRFLDRPHARTAFQLVNGWLAGRISGPGAVVRTRIAAGASSRERT